jgi:hypothetical protein
MKVFLLLWLIVGGIDHGPPLIEVETMAECRSVAAEYVAKWPPAGVDIMRVGCVEELAGQPS